MGIFSPEPAQQVQKTETQQTLQINPELLKKFNLTQEKIDTLHKDQEAKAIEKEVSGAAASYYKKAVAKEIPNSDPEQITLGDIALKPKFQDVSDIPQSLYDQVKVMEPVMDQARRDRIKLYLNAFTQAFGQEALGAKDWKTTVNAYDLSTEGGIDKAPGVVDKLATMYGMDETVGPQIVTLIQQKNNARAGGIQSNPSPTPPAEQPAPIDPKITPYPKRPAPPPPAATLATSNEQGNAKITNLPGSETPDVNKIIEDARKKLADAKNQNFNQLANQRGGLVDPVGTPSTPILGENNLRPAATTAPLTPANPVLTEAPPNPNPMPVSSNTPLAKAA